MTVQIERGTSLNSLTFSTGSEEARRMKGCGLELNEARAWQCAVSPIVLKVSDWVKPRSLTECYNGPDSKLSESKLSELS